MKKQRLSTEQIVSVLKQTEMGLPVADLIRRVGITEQAFYRCNRQYGGLESDQVRELKHVVEENARLKKLVTELNLGKAVLQDVLSKKFPGQHVGEVLNRLVRRRGAPKYLFVDNVAEFTGQLVDLWAYHHSVRINFSRPGKPTDNAYIETFNGSLRDECLNVHWFASLPEAKRLMEVWRQDYNISRPHMGLGNLTSAEYLAGSGFCRPPSGPGKPETNAGSGPPFPSTS